MGRHRFEIHKWRYQWRRLWTKGTFWARLSVFLVVVCASSVLISIAWTFGRLDESRQIKTAVPAMSSVLEDAVVNIKIVEQDELDEPIPDREAHSEEEVGTTLVYDEQRTIIEPPPSPPPPPPPPNVTLLNNPDPVELPVLHDETPVVAKVEDSLCIEGGCDAIDGEGLVGLMIAILSDGEEDAEFRNAARSTWMKSADKIESVQTFFFFAEVTESLQRESEAYGDIIFGGGRDPNVSLAFQMLDHFSQNPIARNIMRIEARSYIAVDRLLSRLDLICHQPGCAGEDVWAGRQVVSRKIRSEHTPYVQDTGLSMYLPYMAPDAYLISLSVASSLSLMHKEIGLKEFHGEHISLGLWMVPMAARRVDLGNFIIREDSCCFNSAGNITLDMCGSEVEDAPFVMGVLDSPQHLVKLHQALLACNSTLI